MQAAEKTIGYPDAVGNGTPSVFVGFLIMAGCIGFAFEDVAPLRAMGGGLLASPGFLFIILAATAEIVRTSRWSRAAPGLQRSVSRVALITFFYGITISTAALLWLPSHLGTVSTLDKTVRFSITVAVFLGCMVFAMKQAQRYRSWFLTGFVLMALVLIGAALMARAGIDTIENSTLLHSWDNYQYRIRGTRAEASSWGGALIACGAAVTLLVSGPKTRIVVVGATALSVLLLGESKGASATMAVGALLALAFYLLSKMLRSRAGGRILCGTMAVACLLLNFVLPQMLQSEAWQTSGLSSGEVGSTETTRSIWAETELQMLIDYPFGQGLAGYIETAPQALSKNIEENYSQYENTNLNELKAVIDAQDDSLLAPRTFPGMMVMLFGVPGMLLTLALYYLVFIALRIGMISHKQGLLLSVTYLWVLTAASTFYFVFFSWDQGVVLGLLFGILSGTYHGPAAAVETRASRSAAITLMKAK